MARRIKRTQSSQTFMDPELAGSEPESSRLAIYYDCGNSLSLWLNITIIIIVMMKTHVTEPPVKRPFFRIYVQTIPPPQPKLCILPMFCPHSFNSRAVVACSVRFTLKHIIPTTIRDLRIFTNTH